MRRASTVGAICLTATTCCSCGEDLCAGQVCEATLPCQQPDGRCNPSTGFCDYEMRPAGTVCREADGECQVDAVCDGVQGICPSDHVPAGTVCGEVEDECVHGVWTRPSTCDGHGTCAPTEPVSCAPYVCGESTCLDFCESDEDCGADFFCALDSCRPSRGYPLHWSGGDLAGSGVSLRIGSDGTRAIATIHGRRLTLFRRSPGSSQWTEEVVDDLARGPDFDLDADGNAHIVYVDQIGHQVRYATNAGQGRWRGHVLGEGSGGRPAIAVDDEGRPHVVYHAFVGSGSELRYLLLDEGEWHEEPVSAGGGMGCGCINDPTASCSCGEEPGLPHLAISEDGVPRVLSPRFSSHQGLELASRIDEGWVFEDVEGSMFLEGPTALAVTSDGVAHASYGYIGDHLRVGTNETGLWVAQDTDIPTMAGGGLDLDEAGARHICVFHGGALIHATDDGGSFVHEIVDSPLEPPWRNAWFCSVAVGPEGVVQIAYGEGETGNLKLASKEPGSSWVVDYVERTSIYGGDTALAVDDDGNDHGFAPRRAFATTASWRDFDVIHLDGAETIEVTTGGSSLARASVQLMPDGRGLSLVLAQEDDETITGLWHGTNEGGTFSLARILEDNVGTQFSLALDPDGLGRVIYKSPGGRCQGGASCLMGQHGPDWPVQVVEDQSHTFSHPALAVDDEGHNHALYTVYTDNHVHYATDAAGELAWTAVHDGPASGLPNALTVDDDGVLHVVFVLSGLGTMYGHTATGELVVNPIVVPEGGPALDYILGSGSCFSLVIDGEGRPRIYTVNRSQELVELVLSASETWQASVLDRADRAMSGASAAVGPDGEVHVIYVAEGAVYWIAAP